MRLPSAIARFLEDDPTVDDEGALEQSTRPGGDGPPDAAEVDVVDDFEAEVGRLSPVGRDLAYALTGQLPPEHRHVPPAMAETQRTIEAMLGERPASPGGARRAPSAEDDDRDARGNRRIVRRYMARMYDAERAGDVAALARQLAEAERDPAIEDEEHGRLASLAASLRRRMGDAERNAIGEQDEDGLEDEDPLGWGS